MERQQAKHISDMEILTLVRDMKIGRTGWTSRFDIIEKMPQFCPKVITAKMRSMIRRGLISGCECGQCRGDYELTEKGKAWIIWATSANS